MTVLSYAEGDNFILRIFSRLVDDNNVNWSNVFELTAREAGTNTTLENTAQQFITFMRNLMLSHAEVYRATVGTWVPDSHPYNPAAFLTVEATYGPGIIVKTNPLPPRVCWHIARDAKVGRPGKLFVRAALAEEDVEAAGADYVLFDPSVQDGILDDAVTAGQITGFFSGGNAPLGLVMIGIPKGETVPWNIGIQTFASKGVTDVQLKHKWYNRD